MGKLMRLLLLFIFTTSPAWADVIATYTYPGGDMITLVTRDRDHVRMDTSPTSYMLLKENSIYSVSRDDQGQWTVMDMDQMQSLNTSGITSLFGGNKTAAPSDVTMAYEKTGRRETIAGYTGTVYRVTMTENGRLVREDEVVLSTHADLEAVNQGWIAIAEKMAATMGPDLSAGIGKAAEASRENGYGGMLRFGNDMRLDNLVKRSLDPAYYRLPANARQVSMAPPPQGQTGGVIEQDAQDVGQAAHQEAKDATIDEVREGVRSVFKSLFD